jgi:predicted O-methyltransferase YrrM
VRDWTVIDGWFGETDALVYQTLVGHIRDGLIIEVGTYLGLSLGSIVPVAAWNRNRIICVDSWVDPAVHEQFQKNAVEHSWLQSVWPLRMTSVEAAAMICRLGLRADLIFIDADHAYESVRDDIAAWLPVLKPDGVMAGHDYHHTHPGVPQAVDEAFPGRGRPNIESSVWMSRELRHVVERFGVLPCKTVAAEG